MHNDLGTGITFLCVGVAMAVVMSIIAYFWQRMMSGIINIWTNWRTLPAILLFYVASTVLVVLGIYFIVHAEGHAKHASCGTGLEQCMRLGTRR